MKNLKVLILALFISSGAMAQLPQNKCVTIFNAASCLPANVCFTYEFNCPSCMMAVPQCVSLTSVGQTVCFPATADAHNFEWHISSCGRSTVILGAENTPWTDDDNLGGAYKFENGDLFLWLP